MRNIISIIFLSVFIFICQSSAQKEDNKMEIIQASKVTFIELGSVNCVPCKMMQPIMKSIEKKYDGQVEVVFYDVWKAEQKKYAQKYKIRVIPTQVFLDAQGKEFHRHEGFYPEEKIDEILQTKGLVPQSKKG